MQWILKSMSKNRKQVLPHEPFHFVSFLADSFMYNFPKFWKPYHEWKWNSFTGLLSDEDFEGAAPGPFDLLMTFKTQINLLC